MAVEIQENEKKAAAIKRLELRRDQLRQEVSNRRNEWVKANQILDGFDQAIEILKKEWNYGPQT